VSSPRLHRQLIAGNAAASGAGPREEPVVHSRAPHGGHVSNRGKKFFFLPQKWGMILGNEVAQA
jgi:hypothetical protein